MDWDVEALPPTRVEPDRASIDGEVSHPSAMKRQTLDPEGDVRFYAVCRYAPVGVGGGS